MDRVIARWRRLGRSVRMVLLGATLVAFVIVATGLIALLAARPALAASSTLTVLGGAVAVRDGAGEFVPAADGQLIAAGTTIRTGPGAHAVLTYVDGSTVTVEPDTELSVEQLEVSGGGDLVVRMYQAVGRAWHVVAHKLGPTGRYEVRTPAATAAVRGTAFTTAVRADGTLDLETIEGVVAASAAGETVEVSPGQATSVAVDSRPAAPAAAPAPQAVVRIVLDATADAVAVDRAGRSVGVQSGQAVRYIPGSRVEVVGGQLVLTIPTNEPGRISTVVRSAAGDTAPVAIRTQVIANGDVVASIVESRQPDAGGLARGGVVLTSTGVIVLPDSEAARFTAPIIGRRPEPPARPAPTPHPLVTVGAGAGLRSPAGGAQPEPTFPGGFQPFGTGAPELVRFTGGVPDGLLPPPPPARDGCPPFVPECVGVRSATPLPAGRSRSASGEPSVPGALPSLPASPLFLGRPPAVPASADPGVTPAPTAAGRSAPPSRPVPSPALATSTPAATRAAATAVPVSTPLTPSATALPSATVAPSVTVAPVASPTLAPDLLPSASPSPAPTPSPSPAKTPAPSPTATPAPTATPCPSDMVGLPGACVRVGGLGAAAD